VLGLNVQVAPTAPGDLRPHISTKNGGYQMWIIGWIADYPDPQDWLSLQFMSNPADPTITNGNNISDVHDTNLDKLLQQADVERDPAKRMSLYNQAEQMVVNEVPWIPYEQAKAFWRMRPWVRGFGVNPIGMMVDIAWPNVAIYSH
jgi:peptide/nickel transport system substrate-binding protein/oligopeptide transport system substrate-binding protein